MRRSFPMAVEALDARCLLSGLSVQLSTNHAVYKPGAPVVITLVETNTSQQNILVSEGPSVDGFSVSEHGVEVWRSNRGPQPEYIQVKTLAPGQSLTITETWNGRANEGKIANPYGPFVVRSESVAAKPVTIRFGHPKPLRTQ